jgi:hypothetical protein
VIISRDPVFLLLASILLDVRRRSLPFPLKARKRCLCPRARGRSLPDKEPHVSGSPQNAALRIASSPPWNNPLHANQDSFHCQPQFAVQPGADILAVKV